MSAKKRAMGVYRLVSFNLGLIFVGGEYLDCIWVGGGSLISCS